METNITTTLVQGIPVVAVDGRIDSSNWQLFDKAIEDAKKATRGDIIVDLGDTRYMSSAALRVLIGRKNELRLRDLLLANLSTTAHEVLHMAGMEKVFPIHDTVDEAVAAAK